MSKKLTRAKFRVKINSLAEEARIIRREERRCKRQDYDTQSMRGCLREHRVKNVREEQRATLLAYAMFRGVPYRAVEPASRKEFPAKDVLRILKSLGDWQYNRTTVEDVRGWQSAVSEKKAA